MDIMFVFVGGALGALLRYLISGIFVGFPISVLGIFIANMIGCFLFGFVSYLALKRNKFMPDRMKKFFTVGIAGGLTTFSTYILDVVKLLSSQYVVILILYMFGSLIIGLFFMSWGMNSAYYVLRGFLKHKRHMKKIMADL